MMKRIVPIICLLILVATSSVSVLAAQSVPQSVLDASDSVVRIFAGDYTGTGFVVASDDKNTYVATNYHVIEDDPDGTFIWLSNESNINASVFAADKDRDMCILKIAFPLGISPVKLSDSGAAKGDAIYAVGFPGVADGIEAEYALDSDSSTITDGIVSSIRRGSVTTSGPEVDILQVNAAINAGNSGGPVFNEMGSAVGISTFGMDESQGIFGAIAINELKTLLDSKNLPYVTDAVEEKAALPVWVYVVIVVAVLLVVAVVVLIIILIKGKKRKSEAEQTEWTFVRGTVNDIDRELNQSPNFNTQPLDSEVPAKKKSVINWSLIIKIAIPAVCILFMVTYFVTYEMSKKSADSYKFNEAYDLMILKPITKLHDYDHFVYVDAGVTFNHGNFDAAKEQFKRLGPYKSAESLCKECDYQKAKQLLTEGKHDEAQVIFKSLGSYSDSKDMITECDYQYAMSLMNSGQYVEAEKAFKKLDGYSDSENMAHESRYRMACEAQTKEDYYLASMYFMKIAKANYKDSKDRYQECSFIKAYTDFYDEEEYLSAYADMKLLANEGYQPAKEALDDMKEIIYLEGIKTYRESIWRGSADKYFAAIDGYKDSDKYQTLIDVSDDWLIYDGVIDQVIKMIDFEDAKDVLVSNTDVACMFLEGKWRTQGGQYYFEITINKDGEYNSEFTLPHPNESGYFDIIDGVYSVNGTNYFKFYIESENTMYVHCYKDGNDYYMYR